jgi:hypothetical protein
MKIINVIGIILILLGIAGFIWGGFSYSSNETVAQAGPIKVNAQKQHNVAVPFWASGVVLGVGIILSVVGIKKR